MNQKIVDELAEYERIKQLTEVELSREWKQTDQREYDEMLGAVPPALFKGSAFMVGEALTHGREGALCQAYIVVNSMVFTRPGYLKHFDPVAYIHQINMLLGTGMVVYIKQDDPSEVLENDTELNGETIVRDPSYKHVKRIVEKRSYLCFTWSNDDARAQPLMVDMTTANMLVTVHDALSEQARDKMERMIQNSRAQFAKVVDVSWKCIA